MPQERVRSPPETPQKGQLAQQNHKPKQWGLLISAARPVLYIKEQGAKNNRGNCDDEGGTGGLTLPVSGPLQGHVSKDAGTGTRTDKTQRIHSRAQEPTDM